MPANYPYIQVPFATSGDKDNIPVQTDPSGAISWTQGYGPDYQRDLETDPLAKPIERGGMNRLFYAISAAIKGWQDNGAPDWVPASETGGIQNPYGLGVWVRYTSGGTTSLYVSLEANNTETPGTGSKWAAAPYRVASPAEMSAGAGAFPATVSQVRTLISTYAPVPPDASTSTKGIVQLSTATNDPSDSSKAATPSAVARKFSAALNPLGTINLNSLTGSDSRGVYWQPDDSLATVSNNYPAGATAGTLFVVGDIGGGSPLQTYIASNGRMWTRRSATSSWLSVSDSYATPIAANDYNAINQNGQYTFGLSAANRPGGFGASWAINFASGGNGGTLAFNTTSAALAYRTVTPGNVGQWASVWTSDTFKPNSNVGCGSFKNLKGSASGTTSTAVFSADALDMTNADGWVFAAKNVNFTVDSLATGAGGIDVGSTVAFTQYAVHAISNGLNSTVGLLSLSATTPTLPPGYTFSRRVGWVILDAARQPLAFTQAGTSVSYKLGASGNMTAYPTLSVGTVGTIPSTWATIGVAAAVPTTASAIKISMSSTLQNSNYMYIAPNTNHTATLGAANCAPLAMMQPTASANGSHANGTIQLEGSNIYIIAAQFSGTVRAVCTGWEDNL